MRDSTRRPEMLRFFGLLARISLARPGVISSTRVYCPSVEGRLRTTDTRVWVGGAAPSASIRLNSATCSLGDFFVFFISADSWFRLLSGYGFGNIRWWT